MEHTTLMDRFTLPDSSSTHFHTSGVSWGAVIAGAFVTAALSVALLALGTGIGLSAVSPWMNAGATANAIGWGAIAWLVLTQIVAASMGGYLAGRLRTRWVGIHTHEVYFRDTAHGFLVWAVSLVMTAAFLASTAATVIGSAPVRQPTAEAGAPSNSNGYFVDSLLRTNSSTTAQDAAALNREAGLIFANALAKGGMPAADRSYLTQVVATRTGMNPTDAEKRVDEVFTEAQQAADEARKAVAHSMYWTFLALLVGAFFASYAATIGGRLRDHVPAIQ